jgi:hypothetical protein
MASRDHLKVLRQGVKVWNAWKTQEPSVRPNLSGARLGEADLSGTDLSG